MLLAFIDRRNNLNVDINGKSPMQKICKTCKPIDVSTYHAWACPIFVLESKAQINPKGLPKWDSRARLGIYLGYSPADAGNVALVLNPATGHMSP